MHISRVRERPPLKKEKFHKRRSKMKNVLEKTFYYCQDDISGAHISEHSPEDLEKDGKTLFCEEMDDPNAVTEFRGKWYATHELKRAIDEAEEDTRYKEDRYEEYLEYRLEEIGTFDFEDGWYEFTKGEREFEGSGCGGIATVEAIIEIRTRDMRDWEELAYDLICEPEKIIYDGDAKCYAYITLGANEMLKEHPLDFDEDELLDIEKAVAEAKNYLGLN